MSNRRGLVGKELKPAVQGVKAGHGKPAMGQGSGPLMSKQPPPKKEVPGAKGGPTQSRNVFSSVEVAERLKVSEDAIRDWLKKGLLKGNGTQIQLYEVEKFKAQYPGELTRAQKHKIQEIPTTSAVPPEAAKPKKAATKVETAPEKKPKKEKKEKSSSPGLLARILGAVSSGLKSLVPVKKPKKNSEPYDKLAPGGDVAADKPPVITSAPRDSGKFHKTDVRASMNAKTPFSNPEPAPIPQSIPTPRPQAVEAFEFDDEPAAPAPPPPRPVPVQVQVQAAPIPAEIQGEKTIQPPSFPEAEPVLDAPPPSPARREDRLSLEGRTSAPPPPSGPKIGPSIRRDALQINQAAAAPAEAPPKRLQTPGPKRPDGKTVAPEPERSSGGFSLGAPISGDNRPPAAPEPIAEVSDWLDTGAAPAPEMPAPLAALGKTPNPWDSGQQPKVANPWDSGEQPKAANPWDSGEQPKAANPWDSGEQPKAANPWDSGEQPKAANPWDSGEQPKVPKPWDSGVQPRPPMPDPFMQNTPNSTENVASRERLSTPPPILWDDVPAAPAPSAAAATEFPWDVPSPSVAADPWDMPTSGPAVTSDPWATPVAPVAESPWDTAPIATPETPRDPAPAVSVWDAPPVAAHEKPRDPAPVVAAWDTTPVAAPDKPWDTVPTEKAWDAAPAVVPERPWEAQSSVVETVLNAPSPVAPESPWVSSDPGLPLASTLSSAGQGPLVPPPFQEPAPYKDGKSRSFELEALQKELEEERKLRRQSDTRAEQAQKDATEQRATVSSLQSDSGQIAALQAELNSSRLLLQSQKSQLQSAHSELRNSQNQLFNGQADLQSALAELAQSKSQSNSNQSQVLALQSQLVGLQSQLENAETRFKESERRSKLQSAEMVSIDKYRELEQELIATKNVAEALQIASRETTFGEQRLIRELEQKLALHEQEKGQVAAQLQTLEDQIQTLEERARQSEHSQQMTEKQLLAVQREKLVLQREQQEFERHWQLKLEDSRQSQESQREQLALQDEKHRQAIAHKEKDIRDLNRRLAQLGPTSEEHNQTKAELEEHRARLEESTKRYKTLEGKHSTQIQRWEKELQAAGNWVGKLTEAVQVKDKRIQELEGQLAQAQTRAKTEGDGQLTAQLLAARVELNTLKRHYETLQQSLEDAEQELTTVKQEKLNLQRDAAGTRGTAGSSAEKADPSITKELLHNRELVKQLETEVVATIVKLAAVEREKLELEAQLRDISEDS